MSFLGGSENRRRAGESAENRSENEPTHIITTCPSLVPISITAIQFGKRLSGGDWVRNHHFHYLYEDSSTHIQLPGVNLQNWARGPKIVGPEWLEGSPRQNACFTRNQPISMSVRLTAKATCSLSGTLHLVAITLDGDAHFLTPPAPVNFTYPMGAREHWVEVMTQGHMPDEIGRYTLLMTWHLQGSSLDFRGPRKTEHIIYGLYGEPFQPDDDSPVLNYSGQHTSPEDGTLSGTPHRLDHLMTLIESKRGSKRYHVTTSEDLIDLYWRLHQGINDTPGVPPYFDAGHDEHLTKDGHSHGEDSSYDLPVEDQWLAWLPTSSQPQQVEKDKHWNDASCIGHVQLAKTMLASMGLFARRVWALPHTSRLPEGSSAHFRHDEQLYYLGHFGQPSIREQIISVVDNNGIAWRASPKLIEPGGLWENFEACLLSPGGQFLPGRYNTASLPASFRHHRGFNSARDLFQWWCHTTRPNGFRRFVCWGAIDKEAKKLYYWDVNGQYYDASNFEQIRNHHLDLPLP